jgi:hypothetical protein
MKIKNVGFTALFLALASAAMAADPTSLDEVASAGQTYLTTAKAVALGFAVLGMGWAGYRVVRKFVK